MTFNKTIILATLFFAGCTAAGGPNAPDNRQVWRDTEGQIVRDQASGTCVRENTLLDTDICAQKQVATHTVIAQEDRTVYFEFNKAALTDEAKLKLNSLAERLTSANDVKGALVAGYADRIGTASYNEKLSKKRAENVRAYLIGRKVVNAKVTKTRWYGKSEPSTNCPNDLPRAEVIQCLQPDRKVQVDISYRVEKQ